MDYRLFPEVTEERTAAGLKLQVVEYEARPAYPPLEGYLEPVNRPARSRQLAIHTDGSGVVTLEPGALQYLRGEIEMEATRSGGGGLGGFLRGAVTAAASGEGLYKTAYRGSGVIYTEPTSLHFLLDELTGEDLIVDDGAFVACAGDITVGRHVNAGLAAAVGSGEGRVQPKLSGRGLFALQSPVPPAEFQVLDLRNETLKVDGNLVLAYTGGLTFSVERSSRGLMGSGRTGEGFVQAYRGTGRVWLAPTLPLHRPALPSVLPG